MEELRIKYYFFICKKWKITSEKKVGLLKDDFYCAKKGLFSLCFSFYLFLFKQFIKHKASIALQHSSRIFPNEDWFLFNLLTLFIPTFVEIIIKSWNKKTFIINHDFFRLCLKSHNFWISNSSVIKFLLTLSLNESFFSSLSIFPAAWGRPKAIIKTYHSKPCSP